MFIFAIMLFFVQVQCETVKYDDCFSWCVKNKNGDLGYEKGGQPIGRAPSCAADCSECDERCISIDGGGGCWSGEKVCCCNGDSLRTKNRAEAEEQRL